MFICSLTARSQGLKRSRVIAKIKLHVKGGDDKSFGYKFDETEYDAVIITVPTHQFGTEIEVIGFDAGKRVAL